MSIQRGHGKCVSCPRRCGADRSVRVGACGAGSLPYIARAALHMWEEPCISGKNGSGAIFFCGCNLRCVFCQNHDISRAEKGVRVDAQGLCDMMLNLRDIGAHNINLVTPTPHADVIICALEKAKARGLDIPIVYNTNGYECTDTLKRLEGLIDIYLPDMKYVSPSAAKLYSGAEDYFEYASKAIIEMQRQVGALVTDENGMAKKGLIVRHLVLPCCVDETRRVLDFIARALPISTHISLMSQYVPDGDAEKYPLINRRITRGEYERAVDYCISLGFENVLIQERCAADKAFTPEFDGYIQTE